jgi:hypothetical protein
MKNVILKSFFILCLILTSCSQSEYVTREPVDPSAATLSKPANNTQCLEVEKVKFEWNKSDNTDSYVIEVKNLVSEEITTKNSNTNSTEITLTKGKPYSWQITSTNNISKKTAKSEIWKFYLSGDPDFNHAPFPAEVIAPKNRTTVSAGAIELSWKVSDVDVGDTHKFDVKLDKVDASTSISTDQSDTKKSVNLTAGVYFWKIISKDDKGNQSDSGIYKFTVQ